jgi:predicted NUDIX family NTP pyrophosphohydrolase
MKKSAGILLYKFEAGQLLFFLVHPGGPYFKKKDAGWWTIPKGELMPDEEPLDCAVREFEEETGCKPEGPYTKLQPVVQRGGKTVMAWACEGDVNAATIQCNDFEMEWPPRSGKMQAFPEIDKAGWFPTEEALQLINQAQQSFIIQVRKLL